MSKFETTETGRGSDTHRKYLKDKIKKDLTRIAILDRLKPFNLEKINDRAEFLLNKAKDRGLSDDEKLELDILQDILIEIIRGEKE